MLRPGKSPWRASQASSAVKQITGASQRTRQSKHRSSTVRTARRRTSSGRIAIEPVLADVEIEGRQIGRTETVQCREHAVEIECLDGAPDELVELRQAVQYPAVELGHRLDADRLGVGIAVERTQKVAQGIAQSAIGVAVALQDLRADADILGVVRADHPKAQDVGAALLHDLLRRNDIAERFRHFAPVFVEHEAMRQHGIVGRAAARPAGFDQRGLKPSAVLVRAFEIKIGRPAKLGALLEHKSVGRARIEPHLDDVGDLFPFGGVIGVAEKLRRVGAEPDIRAFPLDRSGDALDDERIAQRLAGIADG